MAVVNVVLVVLLALVLSVPGSERDVEALLGLVVLFVPGVLVDTTAVVVLCP